MDKAFCSSCRRFKPVKEFHRRSDSGKPRSYCKVCAEKMRRDYLARNPHKPKEWNIKRNARYDPVKRREYYLNYQKEANKIKMNKSEGYHLLSKLKIEPQYYQIDVAWR